VIPFPILASSLSRFGIASFLVIGIYPGIYIGGCRIGISNDPFGLNLLLNGKLTAAQAAHLR